MTSPPVRLRLEARSTVFELDGGRTVVLAVGPHGLAETVLRHDPPTAGELERAIDVVEDALATARKAAPLGGFGAGLATADALLRALPGFDPQGPGLTKDAVEALFQRLASRALGTPVAAAELPYGNERAAALLILRECMHHLNFVHVHTALA